MSGPQWPTADKWHTLNCTKGWKGREGEQQGAYTVEGWGQGGAHRMGTRDIDIDKRKIPAPVFRCVLRSGHSRHGMIQTNCARGLSVIGSWVLAHPPSRRCRSNWHPASYVLSLLAGPATTMLLMLLMPHFQNPLQIFIAQFGMILRAYLVN